MNSVGNAESGTLDWVRPEIDQTLGRAREALAEFTAPTDDMTPLRLCSSYLHQVAGTLKMVELDGAAMLAAEAESLVEAMIHNKLEQGLETATSLLGSSMENLSGYLDKLQTGMADIPVHNLEIMNELRSARGEPAIEIFSIFNPDLEVYPPESSGRVDVDETVYRDRVSEIRRAFQAALLRWLRDYDDGALETLAELTSELQELSRFKGVAQLWWISGAYMELLAESDEEGLQKHLPARLDQLLRKLVEGGEAEIIKEKVDDLIRQMLYDIGCSESSSPRITEIVEAFSLDDILGGHDSDSSSPLYLSDELRKELEPRINIIKESVASYFDGENRDPEGLDRIVQNLRDVSERLDQEGSSALGELPNEVINVLNLARQNDTGMAQNTAELEIAESLLFLEETLRQSNNLEENWENLLSGKIYRLRSLQQGDDGSDGRAESPGLSGTDLKGLLSAVASEIYVNLEAAEAALEAFAAKPGQNLLLRTVPEKLAQVTGALQILDEPRAADMLSVAGNYVERLTNGDIEATPSMVDSLAVAVGTAQAFVEGLEHNRPHVHEMVDRALQDLEDALTEQELVNFDPVAAVKTLRGQLENWLTDNANYGAFRQIRQLLGEISSFTSLRNLSKPARIAQEMNNLLDILTEDPSFMSEEIEGTLRRSLEALEELIGDLENFDVPAGALDSGAGIDPEILGYFKEEAAECVGNIEQLYEAWSSFPDNEAVLIDLRRQFHTLKGSGRTANAGPLAELAWIVEHLLGKVIDHDLEVSDDLRSMVSETTDELSRCLYDEALGAHSLRLEDWQRRADALLAVKDADNTGPEDLSTQPSKSDEEALVGPGSETASDTEVAVGTKLDDTVVRIFTQETLGHLNTIREFLSGEPTRVTPDLLRSVHTLRGTSRSLHLVEMSNVFHSLDEHLTLSDTNQKDLGSAELDLLDQAAILAAATLDRLNKERIFPAALREEFDDLQKAISQLNATVVDGAEGKVDSPVDNISVLGELIKRGEQPDALPETERQAFDGEHEDDYGDLTKVFYEESVDVLARINATLDEWLGGKDEPTAIGEIKRDLHTLKGSARVAGFDAIAELGHLTETLLERKEAGLEMDPGDLHKLMEEAHDTLSEMVGRIERGGLVELDPELTKRMQAVIAGAVAVPAMGRDDETEKRSPPGSDDPASVDGAPAPEAPVRPGLSLVSDRGRRGGDASRDVLRVNTNMLDKLVNYAGEVSITRAQMEEQLSGLRSNLNELRGNVSRFSEQLRELDLQADIQIRAREEVSSPAVEEEIPGEREFDPLQLDRYTKLQQLSRSLSESLDDLIIIQTEINQFVHQSESVLQQQSQLSAELQNGLMSTRLIPFSTLTPKLRHQTRKTGRELGKEVELHVAGGQVEIDRKVLDGMSEAFEHMIRNAVDHGIETPQDRETLGKPRCGSVRIECKQQGSEAIIRFSDDGSGLNLEQIRSRAVEGGLIREKTSLSDQEVIQLIVLPGFTTASAVTQVSGRGVGMDVVHNAVRRLGGSITVESEEGAGTTFVISLPLSLSITQALFVRCGPQDFAISLNVIQNVMKVHTDALTSMSADGQALFEQGGKIYPLMDLSSRLGLAAGVLEQERVPMLIVRMGARDVAVKVSELLSTQEVVVKKFGSHISRMDGLAGATVRGDGKVVIILDLAELWLADERHGITDSSALVKAQNPPLIMVVDDSLTVRKVTGRNLSRHGMEVVMAKDGLDALDQLKIKTPDLMLVDIEMPRMDGYELTGHIRDDPVTRNIPIVMITSRAGTKHKEKAVALGANGYLTKPYQEEELIENVESCLSQARARARVE